MSWFGHTNANLHLMHGMSNHVRSLMIPKSINSDIGIIANPEYQ